MKKSKLISLFAFGLCAVGFFAVKHVAAQDVPAPAASASATVASAPPAATVAATPAPVADPAISADVQSAISNFLSSQSWGVKLLGILVLLNLIGPPLSDLIHNTVLWTATTEDDAFLAKVENNTIFRWAVYFIRIFGIKAHPSQS